ncbi:MAG TPA: S8 family serine peptidase [Candidatus Limnocylindria bacterium]
MRPRRHPVLIVLAVGSLLAAFAAPAAAGRSAGADGGQHDALARDSWIVTLAADADVAAEASGLARAAGGRAGHIYTHALHGFQFRGSAQAAAALESNPRVSAVQADRSLSLTETLPFGIERVRAYGLGGTTGAYQAGFRGNGARIAILDTGIDLDHPELVASIDTALGTNCITAGAAPNDGYGHGTHVSGTAAAPINGIGVAGVAPQARLVAVKMFTDSGTSSEAAALCALNHIIGLNRDGDPANDVDVANMSWGEQRSWGDCAADALHGAICNAHAAGIILVAGAGNSSTNADTFVPAAYPEVVSVSALADFDGKAGGLAGCKFILELFASECDDTFAFFSNRGASVDVIAPGVQIYSSWVGGGWKTSSGTSMATPHVAGIAALMAAAAPGMTPDEARAILIASGECPNGQAADADATAGCAGQGTWSGDPDGIPEPMGHALRAAQAAAAAVPSEPEPPAAPVLSAFATTTSVDLSWTAPDDGGSPLTGFELFRSPDGVAWTSIVAVDETVLAHSDANVAVDETWQYRVDASNDIGATPSNVVTVTVPAEPPPDPVPPSAPALSASATETTIELSWTVPDDDGGESIDGYEIHRGPSASELALYDTVGLVTSFSDTGVAPGETWVYAVAAVNSAGLGAMSDPKTATVPEPPPVDPPSAPSLTATRGNGSVRLNWTAPTDDGGASVTNYQVFRGTSSGNLALVATLGNVLTWNNTGLTNGTTYWFQVAAVNSAGVGARSNEVSATPATTPSPPRSLTVVRAGGGLRLTWLAPTSNGGAAITNYRIYRTDETGSAQTFLVPASQLKYLDKAVAPGSWYAYVVTAINAVGESTASNIVYLQTK